jgi:hypothetical protein
MKWKKLLLGLLGVLAIFIAGATLIQQEETEWQKTLVVGQEQKNTASTSGHYEEGRRTIYSEYDATDKYHIFLPINRDSEVFYPTPGHISEEAAGEIQAGQYAGWNRVVVRISVDGPDREIIYFLITKDYKKFILDISNLSWTHSAISNIFSQEKNRVLAFNLETVTGTTSLPYGYAKSFEVGNFILRQVYSSWDKPVPEHTLKNILPGYKLWSDKTSNEIATSTRFFQMYSGLTDEYSPERSVVLLDNGSGVLYRYILTPKSERDESGNESSAIKNGIDFASSTNAYPSYLELWRPYGCGAYGHSYTFAPNLEKELELFTVTTKGLRLYKLGDANHPILKAAYEQKITEMPKDMQEWNLRNGKPTYEAYTKKHPVLFVKDPWGRWLALGEQQYSWSDGCGKPVIYLYPEKPTKISVRFTQPIELLRDIPIYNNEWYVLAHPDGILNNLKSEDTACSTLYPPLFGQEYAGVACEKNQYPYLYWAGKVSGKYPNPSGGFVVARSDLEDFLKKQLIEIGLNEKERTDMLSYWVPVMLNVRKPYYRVSFFDTEEMNRFIPMDVFPRPDTVIRVFLDWEPLTEYPKELPTPQKFTHKERRGFTLVEWGGLKLH